jgi:hypothetical protein
MNASATAPVATAQVLAWIEEQPRRYVATFEVWRTSCPRPAVWDDAGADNLVRVDRGDVLVTAAGDEYLAAHTAAGTR